MAHFGTKFLLDIIICFEIAGLYCWHYFCISNKREDFAKTMTLQYSLYTLYLKLLNMLKCAILKNVGAIMNVNIIKKGGDEFNTQGAR